MNMFSYIIEKFVLSTIYSMISKETLLEFSNWVLENYKLNKNNKNLLRGAFNRQIEFINLREKVKKQLDGSHRQAVLGLLNVVGWSWNRPDSQKTYASLLKVLTFKKMYICYISPNDLNKKYAYLAFSNGLKSGGSKVHYISRDLIILQSLDREKMHIKAFCSYKGATKRLLKSNKPLNYDKFKGLSEKYNIRSCIDWDNIQLMQDEERIYFYSFLKNSNVSLNKGERALLKRIRYYEGGDTFSLYLERLESKVNLLKEVYDKEGTYEAYDNFISARNELWRATEEQNSTTQKTTINDYL